ncbi:MAG: hypothetical protein GVX90_06895 [Alphaproteobacteria bacterium]|jgi:hypothetical protein|nr:hypothetical protein [Alphaproteobacteria bacterium]
MLEPLFSDYRSTVQDVLAFGLIIAAFVWGGGPERAVAATWLVVFEIFGRLHTMLLSEDFVLLDVDPFLAGKDIAAGAIWLLIALYANRNWTLWVAGTQLLAIGAHLARALADAVSPVAYATMIIAPGWAQLLLLGIGLLLHVLRERKHGPYRSWRTGRGGRTLPLVARVGGFGRTLGAILPRGSESGR